MPQIKNENNNKVETVGITVVYDNNQMLEGLQTDWGFACLVEFEKTKLLFDTGDLRLSLWDSQVVPCGEIGHTHLTRSNQSDAKADSLRQNEIDTATEKHGPSLTCQRENGLR